MDGSPEFGASRELHLEDRTLPKRRFDPNAAAVHLDDLLGNRESEAGAALGLGKRAVDLVELLKDARLLLLGNAWHPIGHADVEMAVDRLGGHAHLTGVGELDGIAHEVKQQLCEALLVTETLGSDLATSVLRASFLFCASESVADLTVSTTLPNNAVRRSPKTGHRSRGTQGCHSSPVEIVESVVERTKMPPARWRKHFDVLAVASLKKPGSDSSPD